MFFSKASEWSHNSRLSCHGLEMAAHVMHSIALVLNWSVEKLLRIAPLLGVISLTITRRAHQA